MSSVFVRLMQESDIDDVVSLQQECFPEPFPIEFLWNSSHLLSHLSLFGPGQFVAESAGLIVGSCSNALISEDTWHQHLPWEQTLGGFDLSGHDPRGTTLYGADISVLPEFRGRGIGSALYQARFDLVSALGLVRYGTACRLPGLRDSGLGISDYFAGIISGMVADRVATPLIKMGLNPIEILENYMDDEESLGCALLLEKLR